MIIVRYADDPHCRFEHESDARRFLDRCVGGYRSLRCRLLGEDPLIEFGRLAGGKRKPARAR